MKWISDTFIWKDGDIRKYEKFCLFPRKVNGEWIWLEKILIQEKFHRFSDGDEWWEIIQIKSI